jgi:hypothetical protein
MTNADQASTMIRWFALASVLVAALGACVVWLAATDDLDEDRGGPSDDVTEDISPAFV